MPQQLDLFGRAPEIPPLLPLAEAPSVRGRVVVATGARDVESRLFSWLEERLDQAEQNPALFGRPIRIVVPSRSLRLHLAAEIPRRRGRSVAGVVVQTLFGAALEILERSGREIPVAGGTLFEVLARRAARNEPSLASGLGDFADGYAAAVGSMRDLLDAGLDPSLAEAVEEVLANDGPHVAPRLAVERARSLVRAASAAAGWVEALGAARPTDLVRLASQQLSLDGAGELWPCRALAIHGFAEATGIASDFLEVLVAQRGADAFIDHPPIPDGRGEAGRERAFAARLTARLAGTSIVEELPAGGESPRVDSFAAAGTDGEVREVLLRIRALLDSGARPEGIAVVARDLEPYRLALRRHAERLAIPISGLGIRGALTPAGSRIEAFLDLLEQRDALPTSRWLDALASVRVTSGRMPRPGFDFRLALAALGAGRLRDAAELELDGRLRDGRYPLPIRHGLFTADEAPEDASDENDAELDEAKAAGKSTSRVPRRTVSGRALAALLESAQRVRTLFVSWPERATVREHLRLLLLLVREELGWPGEAGNGGLVHELGRAVQALAQLGEELPAELILERDEIAPLIRRALLDFGRTALGGAGGGIQVLGVVEARARTFEHLFLVGLNRDAFPRPIREDALLSDALRRTLSTLLPDVPRKRGGFDEERYLFAQILSASPTITLSWQSTDDEGRARPASPLVERFRLGGGSVSRAPGVWSLSSASSSAGSGAGSTRGAALVRPAWERAVATALGASRERYGLALEWALAEAAQDLPAGWGRGGATRAVAQARIAALDEHDPDFSTRSGRARAHSMGPFFGFVGARIAVDTDLPITHLERLAGCPWQYFLGRVLRLEPTPDPLQALPGIDARWVGNLVHAVLDRLTRSPENFESSRAARTAVDLGALFAQFEEGWRPAPAPEWPSQSELEGVLAEESAEMVREEGLPLVGLGRALAERARPYLEIAHSVIEENRRGGFSFAASEAQGSVEGAADSGGRLTFRADRVDLTTDGSWVFTDWKTGKPLSEKKKPENRRADQLTRARQGTLLQAAAYARAAGIGRYVYVRPEAEFREFEVRADDAEHASALAAAAAAGFGARDRGSFFPRLVDPQGEKEPNRCRYCEVAEACLRGDSGARRRLFEWALRGDGERGAPEQAALAVWRLGQ